MVDKTNDKHEMFLRVFEDSPLGILLMKDTAVTHINKRALELIGYDDPKDIIGQNPAAFSPELQPNGVRSEDHAVTMFGIAQKVGYNEFVWVHETKQGEHKWFNIIIKELFEDTATFAAYWSEITDLKKTEFRLQNIMENLPVSVFIKNEKLEVVYMNDYMEERVKFIVGETLPDKLKSEDFIFDEEILKHDIEVDNYVLETGESVEYDFIDHSQNRYFSVIKYLYKDIDGQTYICGVGKDITEVTSANEDVKNLKDSLIKTIQSLTESRDPYTSGHESRVSSLAVAIGKEMNLSPQRIENLRIGSLMHDLGKIQVPLDILNKPGKLSINQMNLVKDHTTVGFDLIKDLEFDDVVKDVVLHHHEKMDGSGYPDGLKGEEISLEARIVCVADVYEAMSSHRPYRPGKKRDEVLFELMSGSGTKYDKKVVDICLKILKKNELEWLE